MIPDGLAGKHNLIKGPRIRQRIEAVLDFLRIQLPHPAKNAAIIGFSGCAFGCLVHLGELIGIVAFKRLLAPAGHDVAVAFVVILHLPAGRIPGQVGEATGGEHHAERAGPRPARHPRPTRFGRVDADVALRGKPCRCGDHVGDELLRVVHIGHRGPQVVDARAGVQTALLDLTVGKAVVIRTVEPALHLPHGAGRVDGDEAARVLVCADDGLAGVRVELVVLEHVLDAVVVVPAWHAEPLEIAQVGQWEHRKFRSADHRPHFVLDLVRDADVEVAEPFLGVVVGAADEVARIRVAQDPEQFADGGHVLVIDSELPIFRVMAFATTAFKAYCLPSVR